MTAAFGPDAPDEAALDEYRRQARAWLEANLERRSSVAGEPRLTGDDDVTAEHIAAQRALQRRLFEAGYAGITWPVEYGGQGLHPAYEQAFAAEASAFVMPDFGVVGGATMGVCAPTMLAHASPELLRRHIPRILSGDEIISQFFSDPDAGSDLAAVRTQAVRDGDRWILNGSKIWSSGAHLADVGMCLARTNWDVSKHRGLTWFLVPTDAPAVTVERIRQINGNAEFCQEFFNDVELTDDDIIGAVDDGWTVTQTMLLHERGGGMAGRRAPKPPGLAPDLEALAEAVGAATDPVARDLIAQSHVEDRAREALGRRLLALMTADPASAANVASYGKLASGVLDPIRAERGMRLVGEAALAWDTTEETGATAARAMLDGRFMSIAGGTSQMQRNTIGERVLGLPREPSFDSRRPFREVVREARSWSGRVG